MGDAMDWGSFCLSMSVCLSVCLVGCVSVCACYLRQSSASKNSLPLGYGDP